MGVYIQKATPEIGVIVEYTKTSARDVRRMFTLGSIQSTLVGGPIRTTIEADIKVCPFGPPTHNN